MQARPVKAASGSDLARLTAIGNLGVNARPAGFGRQRSKSIPHTRVPPYRRGGRRSLHASGFALKETKIVEHGTRGSDRSLVSCGPNTRLRWACMFLSRGSCPNLGIPIAAYVEETRS